MPIQHTPSEEAQRMLQVFKLLAAFLAGIGIGFFCAVVILA